MLSLKLFGLIIIAISLSFPGFAQDHSSTDNSAIEKLAKELMAAKTEAQYKSLLTANKELVNVELQRLILDEGNNLFNQGEYLQSIAIFHLAKTISEQIGDKTGIASAFNGLGNVYL